MKNIRGYEERIRFLEDSLNKKCEEVETLKTAFLNNISHEVRTPMNAIMGFSCLLQDSEITEDEKLMFIDGVMKSSKSLLKIIDNFMLAAKLDAGDLEVKPQSVYAENIINHLYEKFNRLHSPNVEFRINNCPDSIRLSTDPEKLTMILNNLLDNAFKFTQRGFIEFGYQKSEMNKVEFFVQDTGIGIPEDKMDQIFEQFNQLEKRRSKKYSGMGIGLTIAKKLTELLDGDLRVESNAEKGTIFSITLPIGLPEQNSNETSAGGLTTDIVSTNNKISRSHNTAKKFSVHLK